MSDIEALAVELARLLHGSTQYGMVQLLTPVLQAHADEVARAYETGVKDAEAKHHRDDPVRRALKKRSEQNDVIDLGDARVADWDNPQCVSVSTGSYFPHGAFDLAKEAKASLEGRPLQGIAAVLSPELLREFEGAEVVPPEPVEVDPRVCPRGKGSHCRHCEDRFECVL